MTYMSGGADRPEMKKSGRDQSAAVVCEQAVLTGMWREIPRLAGALLYVTALPEPHFSEIATSFLKYLLPSAGAGR